ncbi:MAG: amidophosphoribosyltransferase [Candidatus Bathyarchaeia archaeon]
MAGIVGLYAFDEFWRAARFTYYALLALQHRGQETCGIATSGGGSIHNHGAPGLVDGVFSKEETISSLPGRVGIGATSPIPEAEQRRIQPTLTTEPAEVAVCLDGKILNAEELRQRENLPLQSDSELVGALLAWRIAAKESPLDAMVTIMRDVKGVYSIVALTGDGDMLAARDPHGVKPLVIGSFGFDYGAVASESCVFDVIGADFKMDINPGEVYLFSRRTIERRQALPAKPKHCAFEYVYLARPDSVMNGLSVYDARLTIGEKLAKEHSHRQADVVIGVPETSTPFAIAYSNATGTPNGMGFVQTGRRIRSAIRPTQFERMVGVQLKLNPIRSSIAGKRIILIDDSVVRGTTTKNTVNIMRNRLGAKEIHVRIGSPKLIAPCPYGVEVPPEDELIAANLKPSEVSKVVGADTFHWLSLNGLVEAVKLDRSKLCLGCFTGRYPLGGGGEND